jgi:hypothetical protein
VGGVAPRFAGHGQRISSAGPLLAMFLSTSLRTTGRSALVRLTHYSTVSAADEAPLAGIRVVDFSGALAGPSCAMYLGDLGADVIKVEKVKGGDDAREFSLKPFPALWTSKF